MASTIDHEIMSLHMMEAFKNHFRSALREQLLKMAEPSIEDSINEAMKTFDVATQKYWTPERFGETLVVVLNDSRKK